jgi:hypothetical protein
MLKIIIKAARRLKLRADARRTLIQHIEEVLNGHGIKRVLKPEPNPLEYRKPAPPELLDKVQRDFEAMGFKFKRFPKHTMDTKALEAEGRYRSVDYILELVFRHDELEVDLYYF